MPKIETSSNIIQVGNACFLFLLTSFSVCALFKFSPSLPVFSIFGPEFSSLGDSVDSCCCETCWSGSCCWLYNSTYSGNSFLNAGLSREVNILKPIYDDGLGLYFKEHDQFRTGSTSLIWSVKHRNDNKLVLEKNTYFLQLKAREAFASFCFSSAVVFTLPVVGLLSICIRKVEDHYNHLAELGMSYISF